MRHRVGLSGNDVTETPIYLPRPDALGNLLVIVQRVVAVRVEVLVVWVNLCDVAVRVNLVHHLSLRDAYRADSQ